MARRLRWLLGIAGLLLASGLAFLALRPAAVLVETQTVARGRFVATIEEDGRTRVRERYVISAPVAGRLLRLGVRPGDEVTAGETLAEILPAPSALLSPRARREAEERVGAAEARVQQAGVLLERAAAHLTQAGLDAARVRALHARGTAPLQQLERAELAERTAAREVEAAERHRHASEHALNEVRALLEVADAPPGQAEARFLRAPIGARVLRVLQESEAVVPAGAPLLELGDPAALEVIVDVLTTEAVGIRAGASVSIERWGGIEPLSGRVRRIEPGAFTRISALGVEEQRVWVVIDILSPRAHWTGLGDGFRVDAHIVVEEVENAVLLPNGALFRRGAGWAVFIVADGRAAERGVEVGRRGARSAVALAGVAPGERVVVFPPSALRDGMRVSEGR